MPDLSSLTTNFFPTPNEGFTTTISGPVDSSSATVVPLNSVSGLTNGAIFTGLIDPGNAKERAFTGVVDTGGSQITSVKFTTGSSATHTTGATIVDYVTGTHIGAISKGILVDHSQSGGHEIATNYDPSNPTLETQKWVGVASAVNEVTVTNAATGTNPKISATGGDTNVGLEFEPKGTGNIIFTHFYDWQKGSSTWTYASATTFTVPQSDADLMSVGTKIWFTQTTSKYFYVVSKSGTTVTVTGGSDYSVANAAITAPYFSNAATPVGFPGFFSYSPTFANLTVGNGTHASQFKMDGKDVSVYMKFTLGTTSAVGTAPTYTLPVTASVSTLNGAGTTWYDDTGTANYQGTSSIVSTTTADLRVNNAASTYGTQTAITASIPIAAWANTDIIWADIKYRAV